MVNKNMPKYKFIDLFAGCGGLEDGFLQTGKFEDIAAVEWLKPQVNTLIHRLETKWGISDATERVMHFDIQREDELFSGWDDPEFGKGKGLDYFVKEAGGIDIIIGGPPCQAYSVAGRVRDENGMKDDYRNYLFEHYLNVVNRYKPKLFVFENVPGILSANPNGVPITDLIREGFEKIGYAITNDLKNAKVNAADYGVPQNRIRMIIVGIRKDCCHDFQEKLDRFYNVLLPEYRTDKKMTVREAIGDLPVCVPFYDEEHHKKKKSHETPESNYSWHRPRYHSLRDMDTFKILAEDIESGAREYDSKKISELYEKKVGSKSPIHRYHVLEPDLPSTTIIAHLYKDGNRFIHYDSKQSRSITVREAARLQSFDDDFDFVGSQGNAYQMIGNAVPPRLAKNVALALNQLLEEIYKE
jgi:DNA (cytosine-5)-methyltransferase 1